MAKTKKKYDYRARQGQKRNQQKIADAKAIARNKAFAKKYGKQIVLGVIAAVVLIVAIWLCCKWFVGPGGSIPNWFGTLRDVEENWLITNTGSTSSPKYFKLGEVTAPEGYTLDEDYNLYSDELVQTFSYTTDDENALVQQVYYSGVANLTAEEMIANALSYYETKSDALTATVAGHELHYGYVVSDTTVTTYDDDGNAIEVADEDRTGRAALCIYEDTVQDSCVLVLLQSKDTQLSEVPTQEQLEAEMENFVSLLTVAE